jgi:glycosyltransferase involved in cell wall biosynthesis
MTDLAVIMSIYKKDKLSFVKESVQSILDQTFTQFYYYIVFDGPVSPDIDSYISSLNDDRIKLFRLENNGGLAKALNYLLTEVLKNPENIFIARMDADDISLPTRFERQHTFLISNADISCIGCWYQEIDEAGRHISNRKLPIEHEDLKKLFYINSPFAHPSIMLSRNMIEVAGFYPTDTFLMEDNVLWGRAFKAGLKFANIPEYLLKFRKDKYFYSRRSGMKYGWNFIITRFKMNKSLNSPAYFYLFSFLIGVVKMMPSFLVRFIYMAARRY